MACRSSARRSRSRSTASPWWVRSTIRTDGNCSPRKRATARGSTARRCASRAPRSLLDSLLVTGFHYDIHRDSSELIALFGEFISRARAVRRLGSAALDLCYVAAGRFDAFWEHKLQPWDVAAGALIVEEAGGKVTTVDGAPFGSRVGSVLASNGHIHGEMLETISGFTARFRSRNRTE